MPAASSLHHLSVSIRPPNAPNGLFNGLIWPKSGFASTTDAAMARPYFLPLPAKAIIPREARNSFLRHPPLRSGRKRCVVGRLRPTDRHRGRMVRARKQKTEI
jgi:hypothetical protein